MSDDKYVIEDSIYGFLTMTFKSSLNSHSITIELDISRKEIMVNTLNIQEHSPTELTIMLKNMVTEMKKLNMMFIIQQVTQSDWINILRSQQIFILVNENKELGFVTVKCSIDDFPKGVLYGLGYNE